MRPGMAALAGLLILVTAGCSTTSERTVVPVEETAAQCERLFRALDTAVDRAGTRDGGSARINGYPYLRTNRFLASYRNDPMSWRQAVWWIDLLKRQDTQARAIELANLPENNRDDLDLHLLDTEDPSVGLARCGEELIKRDFAGPESIIDLRGAVKVPDEYQIWKRVLGLYPVTALPFLGGVTAYHADMEAVFATPLEELPILGRLVSYEPLAASMVEETDVGSILSRARRNPLRIPLPNSADLSRLFTLFAPVLEIDQFDRHDQIGVPFLDAERKPDVDTSEPVVFLRAAHTRYAGETLLQLVYSFWFPERPRMSAIDLLAGRLDGITWRVTLDHRGEPLLFDSIHNCGCYHMFFPTTELRLREDTPAFQEPILVPSTLGSWRPGQRVILRIASRTHYIQNVRYGAKPEALAREIYTFAQDDRLRSIQREANSRYSLFRPDGIVPGTQRAERFVFWPMGVPDPGAMRQWGRHATAFIGRRHFDDPRLIERYFEK